jgi:succinoglycan biosynthesis protein ExoV
MSLLLYYHIDPLGNFGDDLNPWLWERVFPGAFSGRVPHDPRQREALDPSATLLIGIGTLLNNRVPAANPKIVLGSGCGYGSAPELDASWRVLAVRGPRSAERLGLPTSLGLLDPGVLAADYWPAGERAQRSGVAYMPHCGSARNADWEAIAAEAGVTFIDPQWSVERVLAILASSNALITEALHGAILAEAFRVPWVPVRTNSEVLEFKWHDWCQSIERKYLPTELPSMWRSPNLGAKLKNSIKRRVAVARLRALRSGQAFALARESVFDDKRARLRSLIDDLRHELTSRAVD